MVLKFVSVSHPSTSHNRILAGHSQREGSGRRTAEANWHCAVRDAKRHGVQTVKASQKAFALGYVFCCCVPAGSVADSTTFSLSQSRGIVVARAKASIAAELVARVEELPFAPGQKFKAGDVLVRFDCRRYEAERLAAAARLRAKKGILESNLKLASRRAIGTTDLEVSRAEADQAQAELEALSVRTSQCVITAPYGGRVVELFINEYEMPQANTPLIRIVDDQRLEIEIIVPSQWLAWLKPGMPLQFKIDETQTSYRSEVLRVGSIVDPISQTVKLTAKFRDKPEAVLPGMSGSAEFVNFASKTKSPSSVGRTQ